MPDIVALELEARAQRAELAHAALDLGERIREDEVLGRLEVRPLPAIAPFRALLSGGGYVEVERTHVHRCDFRRHPERRRKALIERHAQAAAGGDVDDGVGSPLDLRQELEE